MLAVPVQLRGPACKEGIGRPWRVSALGFTAFCELSEAPPQNEEIVQHAPPVPDQSASENRWMGYESTGQLGSVEHVLGVVCADKLSLTLPLIARHSSNFEASASAAKNLQTVRTGEPIASPDNGRPHKGC